MTSMGEGTAWPSKRSGSSDIALSARALMSDLSTSKAIQSGLRFGERMWIVRCAEHNEFEHLKNWLSPHDPAFSPSLTLTSPQNSFGAYKKWCSGASSLGHGRFLISSARKAMITSAWHMQFVHMAATLYSDVESGRESIPKEVLCFCLRAHLCRQAPFAIFFGCELPSTY